VHLQLRILLPVTLRVFLVHLFNRFQLRLNIFLLQR
jgi:hypothetical protein